MPGPGKGGRYHHGDLRAALVDTAIEIIGERGVRGFSLAEASRRLGVAVSAPYAISLIVTTCLPPSPCMPISSSMRNSPGKWASSRRLLYEVTSAAGWTRR